MIAIVLLVLFYLWCCHEYRTRTTDDGWFATMVEAFGAIGTVLSLLALYLTGFYSIARLSISLPLDPISMLVLCVDLGYIMGVGCSWFREGEKRELWKEKGKPRR